MTTYETQTNVLDTFKIDFFASFATHPETVKNYVNAKNARTNMYMYRSAGTACTRRDEGAVACPFNESLMITTCLSKMTDRDLYCFNSYDRYINLYEPTHLSPWFNGVLGGLDQLLNQAF